MLKKDQTKTNPSKFLIKTKEVTNEYQLLLPLKNITIPIGYHSSKENAIKRAVLFSKELSASVFLMRKKLASTNGGFCFEFFSKEAEIKINVHSNDDRHRNGLQGRRPGKP